jgi:hypothetical protein
MRVVNWSVAVADESRFAGAFVKEGAVELSSIPQLGSPYRTTELEGRVKG